MHPRWPYTYTWGRQASHAPRDGVACRVAAGRTRRPLLVLRCWSVASGQPRTPAAHRHGWVARGSKELSLAAFRRAVAHPVPSFHGRLPTFNPQAVGPHKRAPLLAQIARYGPAGWPSGLLDPGVVFLCIHPISLSLAIALSAYLTQRCLRVSRGRSVVVKDPSQS